MAANRKQDGRIKTAGRFSPTHPWDLNASLRIRDGLAPQKRPMVSQKVLNALQGRALLDRGICPN
ncbi:MAG: hypothetical protein ACE5ER_11155 [Nitrospinaceae bacterium]